MDKYRSNCDNIWIKQDLMEDKWLSDWHEWFITGMQYDWQQCRCALVTIATGFIFVKDVGLVLLLLLGLCLPFVLG